MNACDDAKVEIMSSAAPLLLRETMARFFCFHQRTMEKATVQEGLLKVHSCLESDFRNLISLYRPT